MYKFKKNVFDFTDFLFTRRKGMFALATKLHTMAIFKVITQLSPFFLIIDWIVTLQISPTLTDVELHSR